MLFGFDYNQSSEKLLASTSSVSNDSNHSLFQLIPPSFAEAREETKFLEQDKFFEQQNLPNDTIHS
jgi:hypothetical protein